MPKMRELKGQFFVFACVLSSLTQAGESVLLNMPETEFNRLVSETAKNRPHNNSLKNCRTASEKAAVYEYEELTNTINQFKVKTEDSFGFVVFDAKYQNMYGAMKKENILCKYNENGEIVTLVIGSDRIK